MNHVSVTTHNEGTNNIPDKNWRSTLTASEQHAIIFHLVSALRTVSSNVSLEHLVAIVNAFEKHAYEKASSKMEYINICNTKLMHIKGSTILKQSSLQTQNQQSSVQFFPQVQHQHIVSGQPKTFEHSQTPGLVSQTTFTCSTSQQSEQAMDSHSKFQRATTLLNPKMTFQKKQTLMKQTSTNPHLSTQNLMQSLNCPMNQQSLNVNSTSDDLKFLPHSVSHQKALQIQQILNQLRAQNNQQQYPQYITHRAHVFQSSDKHQQSLNQQQIHMSLQTDMYQQCSDGSLFNPSNINLQKFMTLSQTTHTQNQNEKPQQSQSQAKQLLSNQSLQGFSSQIQAPVQQIINPQVQKRMNQTTVPSTSHGEFKKHLDPHLNPCNYLIPQRILAQLPEPFSNVSTWTQVAELLRNQRLSSEQMTRVHDLFYQHALCLQLHYQQIQQMTNKSANQSVNQFQSHSLPQLHSIKPGSQIQQQQIRQNSSQMQHTSNITPEFIKSEWSSDISNFSSYPHVFFPNTNTSLNNSASQSQFQSIDQLLAMTSNDNVFGLKKRSRSPIKIKKKEDNKSVKDQHHVLQASNLVLSSPVQNEQTIQFKQDSNHQSQSDNSIIQKILMCGGKEANMQMISRLKQIQDEVERNGVKISPLNDLTSVQKQQVSELVAQMNQMYHHIDTLLPLFMALSANEFAVKQLLQMKLIYKKQFDVLPQGIYLCCPSQLIKIKKIISEYFKFVKINVYAIQKQIENGKPLSDKMTMNLSETNSSVSKFHHTLADTISSQIPNETLPSKLFETSLKNNIKTNNVEMILIKENNSSIDNNFSDAGTISKGNSLSSEKVDMQIFDLCKESHNSQVKDKVMDNPSDYMFSNVASALKTDDNEIFPMNKSFFNEKKNTDILSNKFGSKIISDLEMKIPQPFVVNVVSDQSLEKDQNDLVNMSTIEDGKLSSNITISPVTSEKRLFSSSETVFSSVISSVLENEKILNDINFDQYFDLAFNDKIYGNNVLNSDKLQENRLGSVFDIDETKLENTIEGLEWDFQTVSNIGPFKIKDFYASNNENIWNSELKTRDLSALGLGIVANVY
ncbi:hypothetical protein PMAC_002002 [Pneumocystis sp. 'macacae']|nr:hypothetical protein PMAC_002002 [Pneumocystis sp. 'macacae']